MVQPGGLDAFFADLADATAGGLRPELPVIAGIFSKHGLDLLGPPLGAR